MNFTPVSQSILTHLYGVFLVLKTNCKRLINSSVFIVSNGTTVDLLHECIMIRDIVFTLPDFYTVADVQSIILYICSLG